MIQRMIRAACLDARVYQELRDDPTATIQAFWVMVLSGSALALGGIVGLGGEADFGLRLQVFTWRVSAAVVGWLVLSLLAYGVGRRLLGRMVTFPSLLRTIGFANVPGVFYILVFIGGSATQVVNAAILVWVLFAMVPALRQTLQVSFLVGFCLSIVGVFFVIDTIRYLAAEVFLAGVLS